MTIKLGKTKNPKGAIAMNKEEILAKAQAEKKDEMESFITDRSMRWTYIVMVMSAGIFTIIRSLHDLPIMDLCCTVCFSVAAGHIYRFVKTREKFYIIIGLVMAVMGVFAGVRYFMGH